MRRTKIVATIGPATWTPERLDELFDAGLDVVRLNFSHAAHDDARRVIRHTRDASDKLGRSIAVLGDLQGPKIRTGTLAGGGPVQLVPGQECTITTEQLPGTAQRLSTSYAALPHDVRPGQRILLADGTRVLEVIGTSDTEVRCRVIVGGPLGEHQGINLPGVRICAPALTEKDVADLDFCLGEGVDYVAISFVRKADDIADLRRRIRERGHDTPIVAKIEKPEALEQIGPILNASDVIMVARGDLGVEMPAEQVPLEQKKLIALCNSLGKPVITATEMLQSMVASPRPTRAEASDVANAIFDGTDAVMLSAETSIGKYPVDAVRTMARIAEAVEQASFRQSRRDGGHPEWRPCYDLDVTGTLDAREHSIEAAAADAAVSAARDIAAAAIVVFTISGSTAMKIAKRRPASPIYAITPSRESYRRLALVWGVRPVLSAIGTQTDHILLAGEDVLLKTGALHRGDIAVLVSGAMPVRGATNFVKIRKLGD
ncbi:MAG TPA: pyruvate kinase [Planctomycetota bacterium]|nr:pyruvate kinase [Planctomycetota bacterium]